MELVLRPLIESDEAAFKAAIAEFKSSDPEWFFAFDFDDKIEFSAYLLHLDAWTRGKDLPRNFVPNSFLVAVVGDRIVGRASIRHQLNDFLFRLGGHIGYGVVASCRRQGYATAILKKSLQYCKKLGMDRVLVTCDEDNIASCRVIEANKGILENTLTGADLKVPKRRYWINLPIS